MKATRVVATFHVKCQSEMHARLDAAVAAAHLEALGSGRQGVLVTRHEFDQFSVSLSRDVPFRLTREQDQASRH